MPTVVEPSAGERERQVNDRKRVVCWRASDEEPMGCEVSTEVFHIAPDPFTTTTKYFSI